GVDNQTIKACADAGANVFVAGSYVFKTSDLVSQVETLRVALNG
ncbi:ribulose-phosphate 3-epimerase, partial [Streptococcus pluranimalium]